METEEVIKRILSPVDGSASSFMAEETAARIAKKTGSKVTVLHIIPPLLRIALELDYRVPTSVMKDLSGLFEQKANKIIDDSRSLFAREGVAVDAKVLRDSHPAESILQLSEANYDLIVIGARGEDQKDPHLLGSITKKVVRHAKCPTLVVKKASTLSKILVYFDGSEYSIKALKIAANFAKKMNSEISVLTVLVRQLLEVSPETAGDLSDRIFSKALEAIGKQDLEINKIVEFGYPSNTIVEVAKRDSFDLIILGSKGIGAVKRFLLGNVAEGVCSKAECSVLIVR